MSEENKEPCEKGRHEPIYIDENKSTFDAQLNGMTKCAECGNLFNSHNIEEWYLSTWK